MIDLYAYNKLLIWIICIIAPIMACLGYEFGWRRRFFHAGASGLPPYVQRFNLREMINHWLCILLGIFVIITGITQIVNRFAHSHIGTWHECAGWILLIVGMVKLFSWAKACRYRPYDFQWLRIMGGYLSKSFITPPAGRFNAGQKIYFWLINALIIFLAITAMIMEQHSNGILNQMGLSRSLHGLAGCMFTVIVIGHAYLSLFVNPATARVLLDGKISLPYLRAHHSRMEL